ncbi:MAG: hypothetical protein V1721_08430 [Pseudomonadota bacterium]
MLNDIKGLRLQIQKAIDLGEIDRRLRGISEVTPRFLDTASRPSSTFLYDAYSHTISYASPIRRDEITNMVGFRKLLHACFREDVMLTVKSPDIRTLNIRFEPTSHFSESSVFGASHSTKQVWGGEVFLTIFGSY